MNRLQEYDEDCYVVEHSENEWTEILFISLPGYWVVRYIKTEAIK